MYTSPVTLIFIEISRNIVVVPEGVAGLVRLVLVVRGFIYIEFVVVRFGVV